MEPGCRTLTLGQVPGTFNLNSNNFKLNFDHLSTPIADYHDPGDAYTKSKPVVHTRVLTFETLPINDVIIILESEICQA